MNINPEQSLLWDDQVCAGATRQSCVAMILPLRATLASESPQFNILAHFFVKWNKSWQKWKGYSELRLEFTNVFELASRRHKTSIHLENKTCNWLFFTIWSQEHFLLGSCISNEKTHKQLPVACFRSLIMTHYKVNQLNMSNCALLQMTTYIM